MPGRSRAETVDLNDSVTAHTDTPVHVSGKGSDGGSDYGARDDGKEGDSAWDAMSATTEDILFGLLAQEHVRRATAASNAQSLKTARARAVQAKAAMLEKKDTKAVTTRVGAVDPVDAGAGRPQTVFVNPEADAGASLDDILAIMEGSGEENGEPKSALLPEQLPGRPQTVFVNPDANELLDCSMCPRQR